MKTWSENIIVVYGGPGVDRRWKISNLGQMLTATFFLKSNSPKKVRSHIDHSKSTNHKRHFCQRDLGFISHLFSSRLVSKFYSRSQKKLKFYHKTLNSWPIDPNFCMMVESGQEKFLMSWVWKNLCTMGQNLIFYENF